jgi:signal transduction histidine kinase
MDGKSWRWLPWRRRAFTADPKQMEFGRLFRRLFLWYFSLLAVLVILLVLGIGSTVPWIVFVSTEHDLTGRVAQLAQIWQNAPDQVCPLELPGQGYMLACYNDQGKLIKSMGVSGGPEEHFLGNSLALAALDENSAVQDALDESGTEQVQFDFVFPASPRPGMVRQAIAVRKPGSNQILGIVQLGTTPAETLARRQVIANIFFAVLALAMILGVPAGAWYLASKALLPTKLAFQRQRDFIANVSHELSTPLALLRANAEVLLRSHTYLAEEDAALLEDIVAETNYMDKMTSHMLLLARMDADQLRLEREALDLGKVAEGIVRQAHALAHQAGITLVFHQEDDTWALGDQMMLQQATLILLDNALKYTPTGGKVTISTFTKNDHACLQVKDTGIGIAPTDLARLGERFYRVDKAHSRETGGSGLGLSIVRGIMAAHKGELTLTSEPGKGTCATLLLPVARK